MSKLNEQEVLDFSANGMSPKEIAEKLGSTHQAVGKIIRDAKKNVTVDSEVVETVFETMSASEYEDYSKRNGRTSLGGEIGVKVEVSLEDFRAKLNSDWTPSVFMEKYQWDEEDFKQMCWKLSALERRDREPTINFKRDIVRFH